MSHTFAELSSRCFKAAASKYDRGRQGQAMRYLANELQLIQECGWQTQFLEADEFFHELRATGTVCRLVGSGCSSIVNFLLGMSDVDPVRYHLRFHRFYPVERGPQFSVSVGANSVEELGLRNWLRRVAVRHMTPLEKAAWLCPVDEGISPIDEGCYEVLWNEAQCDIYALDWRYVKQLAGRMRPTSIQQTATVTALAEISFTHPQIVESFVRGFSARGNTPRDKGPRLLSRPIIYQEQVMACLHRWAGIPWRATYDFVKRGARGNWNTSELETIIRDGLNNRSNSKEESEERFRILEAATKHSVCKAHFIAEAITTQRAVFLKSKCPEKYRASVHRFSESDTSAV